MTLNSGDPWPQFNGTWSQWNTLSWPLLPPQQGWQCPVCGTVYSPSTEKCSVKHRKPKDDGMTMNEIRAKYFPNMSDEDWESRYEPVETVITQR